VVVKEELDDGRWLNVGQILVGQTGHRAFKSSNQLRRFQGVFIGLVLDSPAQAIAQGHDEQPKDGGQHQYQGNGRYIG